MQADYLDAHQRHWEDGELLFEAGRWANADQLYGLSVECGLKRLMLAFGMRYDATKDKPEAKVDQVHADGAWVRFESYRCGHHRGVGYGLPNSNGFDGWKIEQRYAHRSNFDAVRAQKYRIGAEQVRQLIRKAQLEGLIP